MGSEFKNLRKFHNWIKNEILKSISKTQVNILELAGGSGGDLLKWNSNKNVIKVDSYDIVIDEANRRLKKLNVNKPIQFYKKDLGKEPVNCNTPYDIISCHFAFHYFFENIFTFKTIMKTINGCSKKGTIFVITLFDGNKLQSCKDYPNWYVDILPSKNKIFGRKVEVFVKNTQYFTKPYVEYVVDLNFLEKKMNVNGWTLFSKNSFQEWYKKQTKFVLTEQEERFSFNNTSLMFVKN
jgi:ubiquinone/menaquinone biosynthesis C-methylase UbiE